MSEVSLAIRRLPKFVFLFPVVLFSMFFVYLYTNGQTPTTPPPPIAPPRIIVHNPLENEEVPFGVPRYNILVTAENIPADKPFFYLLKRNGIYLGYIPVSSTGIDCCSTDGVPGGQLHAMVQTMHNFKYMKDGTLLEVFPQLGSGYSIVAGTFSDNRFTWPVSDASFSVRGESRPFSIGHSLAFAIGKPFKVGDRIRAQVALKVRSNSSISSTGVGTAASGSYGTVLQGPTKSADGLIWWKIKWDLNGLTGWSIGYINTAASLASDTTPPSVPTGLSVLTADNFNTLYNSLVWKESIDNVGVVGYKIYRCDGTTAASSSCIPTTQVATSNTQYYYDYSGKVGNCYAVAAYDAAGNTSGKSAVACASSGGGF